jgi:hypothetical protein
MIFIAEAGIYALITVFALAWLLGPIGRRVTEHYAAMLKMFQEEQGKIFQMFERTELELAATFKKEVEEVRRHADVRAARVETTIHEVTEALKRHDERALGVIDMIQSNAQKVEQALKISKKAITQSGEAVEKSQEVLTVLEQKEQTKPEEKSP